MARLTYTPSTHNRPLPSHGTAHAILPDPVLLAADAQATHPWRTTAVTPGGADGWATCTECHRTYLEALAQARRLACETEPAGGHIRHVRHVRSSQQAIEGYVVTDADGGAVRPGPPLGHPPATRGRAIANEHRSRGVGHLPPVPAPIITKRRPGPMGGTASLPHTGDPHP